MSTWRRSIPISLPQVMWPALISSPMPQAHQAWYASVNALFGAWKKFKVDYSVLPWTTFIDPEVARVGLNEQEAAEKNIDYEVTRFDFAELDGP